MNPIFLIIAILSACIAILSASERRRCLNCDKTQVVIFIKRFVNVKCKFCGGNLLQNSNQLH